MRTVCCIAKCDILSARASGLFRRQSLCLGWWLRPFEITLRDLSASSSRRMGGAKRYPSTLAFVGDGLRFALPILREYDFAFSRRRSPEVCISFGPLRIEGAGKTGALLHPRSRVRFAQRKMHTSIQGSGSIPAFPAQWLYGLLRALPGERLSCHRRP